MNLSTMRQFHQTGTQNLMQGGQHAHGWNRPVAGVGLPSMGVPNKPGFMAGGAFSLPPNARWGNHLPNLADSLQLGVPMRGEQRGQRGPFGEEQDQEQPPQRSSGGSNSQQPRYDEDGYRNSDGRKKIMGYSQSQGANTTRSGPLSPRTSYKPTSMLPLSQRYSR